MSDLLQSIETAIDGHQSLPVDLSAGIGAVAPHLSDADIAGWTKALTPRLIKAQVNTPHRVAAFLGQVAEESGEFAVLEENLMYQAPRLCVVWPSHFPTIASALPYSRNPKALANHVYAGRLGNGDEKSGDGYRFRGAGLIQITGRTTYTTCGTALGRSVDDMADFAQTKEGAAATAAWFWNTRSLNSLADAWAITALTKKVNGGVTNLSPRIEFSNLALKALGGS